MSLRLLGAASASEQDQRCWPQGASRAACRMFPKQLRAFVVRKECSSCPASSPFKALCFPVSHMIPFPVYSSLQLYFTSSGFSLARSNIGNLYALLRRNISLQNPTEQNSPPATLPRGVHKAHEGTSRAYSDTALGSSHSGSSRWASETCAFKIPFPTGMAKIWCFDGLLHGAAKKTQQFSSRAGRKVETVWFWCFCCKSCILLLCSRKKTHFPQRRGQHGGQESSCGLVLSSAR